MAVGWAVRKAMGKGDETRGDGGAASSPEEGSGSVENVNQRHWCCQKSTLRWIITLALSLQLLVFLLVSLPLRGGHHGRRPVLPIQAPIMFMFKLQRSASVIRSYKSELESNLSSHIQARNMKVSLYAVKQIPDSDWAEVRFQLLPEHKNSTYDVKVLRGNLVKFFLQERNLNLTPTTFGKVFDFQINKLQGGITIVPENRTLSRRSPLFNFTLNNATISTVSGNLTEFKRQLSLGLCLRPMEALVLRLTNENGSTVESPVVVQNLVFHNRHHLHHTRLKQLAKHVWRHKKNLGLNVTTYGIVETLELAPVLEHLLNHSHSPGPSPAPTPGPLPGSGYDHFDSVSLPPAPSPGLQVGLAAPSPVSENLVPQRQQGFAPAPAPVDSNSGSGRFAPAPTPADLSGGVVGGFAPAPAPVDSGSGSGRTVGSVGVVVFGLVASVWVFWVAEKPG